MVEGGLKGLVVRCPTCGKKVKWVDAPYRPFCSQRCKLVDLGKWLDGTYKLSSPLDDESQEDKPSEEA